MKKNSIIKNLKLIFIISIIILVAFSQVFQSKNSSNKLSPKDIWLLIIYIFGIIFIPLIAFCMSKLKKKRIKEISKK